MSDRYPGEGQGYVGLRTQSREQRLERLLRLVIFDAPMYPIDNATEELILKELG